MTSSVFGPLTDYTPPTPQAGEAYVVYADAFLFANRADNTIQWRFGEQAFDPGLTDVYFPPAISSAVHLVDLESPQTFLNKDIDCTTNAVYNIPVGNIVGFFQRTPAIAANYGISMISTDVSGVVTTYVKGNVAALPNDTDSSPVLQVAAADSAVSRILVDAFGNFPSLKLRRSNGVNGNFSNLAANDVVGEVVMAGYSAGAYQPMHVAMRGRLLSAGNAQIELSSLASGIETIGLKIYGGTVETQGSFSHNISVLGTPTSFPVLDTLGNFHTFRAVCDDNVTFNVPVAAFNYAVPDDTSLVIFEPAGTLASGTVTFPANPRSNQKLKIASTQIITALTLAGNGKTIKNPITTIAAGGFAEYIYRLSNTSWYRIG